ncbi:MAG TPA: hypothetical protein VF281_00710 [Candidatus Saccharimonadales bacterium]
MQPNPFQNSDPNSPQTPPAASDPWAIPQQSSQQLGYSQPQVNMPPAQQPQSYDPWQIQTTQPGYFQQPTGNPAAPTQQWNPETSMFEPIRPAQPSAWEQQFVAETVAAATAPPAPKKSHVGRVIAIVIGLLVLIGGGAAAYLYTQQQQTESNTAVVTPIDTKKLFYEAIENHMKVSYIRQQYDSERVDATNGKTTVDIIGISDFTDPAKPKSKVSYEINSTSATPPLNMAGELIDLQEQNYYAKLTNSSLIENKTQTTVNTDFAMDTWYSIPKGDTTTGALLFDPGGTREIINVSSGQVLVGNYKDEDRQKLMAFINENQVYTIGGTETVSADDKAMTRYNISIDTKVLEELNKKAEDILGTKIDSKRNPTMQDADVKYEFLIDNDTKHIVEVKLSRQSSDEKTTDTETVLLSYPKSAGDDVKKPVTIKNFPTAQ